MAGNETKRGMKVLGIVSVSEDGRTADWWKEKLMQTIAGVVDAEGVTFHNCWHMDIADRKLIMEEYLKWEEANKGDETDYIQRPGDPGYSRGG